MRTIAILTLKDLRRRVADPAGLLLTLAVPLVMAAMMGLAFGGRGDGERTPVLRLLVLNFDDGPIGRALAGAGENPEAAGRMEVGQVKSRKEGLERLREDEAAALVVIPANFTADILEGRRVAIEVLKNPAQSIMPVVAQQGAEVAALYLSVGSRLLAGEGRRIRDLFEGKGWDDATAVAALVVELYNRVRRVDDLLIPPIVEVATQEKEKKEGVAVMATFIYPGIMLMGLLFTGIVQMRDLLKEGEAGTLRRQLAAPLGAGRVVAAKVLAVAAVVAVTLLFLMLGGRWVFGTRWGPIGPLAATSAALVLVVTGLSTLVFSIVRTERQGDTLGTILVMLMSMLGGSFFPPQLIPSWMQGLSRLTITYWGNDALRALASGGGWERVGDTVLLLLAAGTVLILSGVFLLRRRHLRGAL